MGLGSEKFYRNAIRVNNSIPRGTHSGTNLQLQPKPAAKKLFRSATLFCAMPRTMMPREGLSESAQIRVIRVA